MDTDYQPGTPGPSPRPRRAARLPSPGSLGLEEAELPVAASLEKLVPTAATWAVILPTGSRPVGEEYSASACSK